MTSNNPRAHNAAIMPAITTAGVFYVWFDDTPKKPTSEKLDEAINGFIARFATRPSHVSVNSTDIIERSDVFVTGDQTVQPNTFWLSMKEVAPVAAR